MAQQEGTKDPGAQGFADDPRRDVRVRDPAMRDQDRIPWRRGRFAERVRREWNPIGSGAIEESRMEEGYDLARLATLVHARVGGDLGPIESRLREFARMEEVGEKSAHDPLVRPGT